MVEVGNVGTESTPEGPSQQCHSSLEKAHDKSHFQGFPDTEFFHKDTTADANSQAVHR